VVLAEAKTLPSISTSKTSIYNFKPRMWTEFKILALFPTQSQAKTEVKYFHLCFLGIMLE